jgi:hypothetical protein
MIPGSANPLLLASAAAAADGGYAIERSLRFNSADSAYLSRTPASVGNRKKFTLSCWIKRSGLGADQFIFGAGDINADLVSANFRYRFSSTDLVEIIYGGGSSSVAGRFAGVVFRDCSAYYHLVLAIDNDQSTIANAMKLYVNGEQSVSATSWGSVSYSSGLSLPVNSTVDHRVGSSPTSGGQYFNGYLADIHFIDGQALDPTSFGEFSATTGVWVPKAFAGSYGTNGFRLPFSDNSAATATTLGKDSAGSNNWTPNNLSVTAGAGNDSLVDVPTNGAQTDTGAGGEVRGNYATFNPLWKASAATISNGNLDCVCNGSGSGLYGRVNGTIGISSGKFYWEVTVTSNTSTTGANIGIALNSTTVDDLGAAVYNANGRIYPVDSAYGATYTQNDVIGVALNMDAGTLVFYKNGVGQGTAFSSLSGTYFPSVANGGGNATFTVNFGQRPFAYTAPSGFKALNTANLPAPVVTKPSDVMDVALWTGNGSSPRSITGLGFNPDFVWIKERSAGTYFHRLFDAVRGTSNSLYLPGTEAENTYSSGYANVSSFNSDGFTLTGLDGGNNSSVTYVAWAWDAGTTTTTNTVGSISSQVRANASAGFSVVGWNYPSGTPASTIGHGLGVKPSMIILKNRSGAANWIIYHTSIGATKTFRFNTQAASTESDPWNNTEPTSTVFSIGAASWHGAGDLIAYCFAPVAGYSAFGSYTGNGSADGPFVFTSFRPRWIMLKDSTNAGNWELIDAARIGYNGANYRLFPNTSEAEFADHRVDILSNGFKLRVGAGSAINSSNAVIVYAAFAEHPFQYARAR